jgi:hypothetical protein
MPGWEAFFTAQVAASATLAGLMFVGVSLNLAKILKNPSLPNRALAGFVLLMAILILSSLQLVPEQALVLRGAEILVVGVTTWLVGSRLDVASVRQSNDEFRHHFVRHAVLFQIAALPYVVGGALVVMGRTSGFYWVAAAIVLSLAVTLFEAWILLVEINR